MLVLVLVLVLSLVVVTLALAGGSANADAAGSGAGEWRAGRCLRDDTSSSAFLGGKLVCGLGSEGASESGVPSFTRGEDICAADVQRVSWLGWAGKCSGRAPEAA